MARLTIKRFFKFHDPSKKTTTLCINNYTFIKEEDNEYDPYNPYPDYNNYLIGEGIDKLSMYEDAEETGSIKMPPCNIGDYVYQIDQMHNKIHTKKVRKIIFETAGRNQNSMEIIFETAGHCYDSAFGKTVFKNKVEAMNALQKGSSK